MKSAHFIGAGPPCLGRFPVGQSGNVLLFPAEDSLAIVRQRLQGIADAAQVLFASLPSHASHCAAIRGHRELLVTGDKRDFGHVYGQKVECVRIVPLLQLADVITRLEM